MAIVNKTYRDGVDTVIQYLQNKWYNKLLGNWGNSVYQMYPRANKNKKEDQTIPEISLDEENYDEVLINDKFDVTSFFLIDNESTFTDEYKRINQRVSLIFQADLFALYNGAERMDQRFNMDVLRVVRQESQFIFGDISLIETVDDVYRDLSLSGDFKRKIDVTDISHQHILRVDFNLIYKPNCNATNAPASPGTFAFQLNGTTIYEVTVNDMNNQEFNIIA